MPWQYSEKEHWRQTSGKGIFVPATGCGSPELYNGCSYNDAPDEPMTAKEEKEYREAMAYLARENEYHNRKMSGQLTETFF